ncbi:multidrug resistance protein MdtH [Shouchella clausii]|nr:multidrug resistance protein MdtH [Shouchella clausii]
MESDCTWKVWRTYGWRATLLIGTEFFLTFSFFMFVPYISLYVTGELGYSLSFAGLLLALRLTGQQGFMMFGGYLGDKFGYKAMMFIGFVCRGAGFAGIGFAQSPALLLFMAVIGGLGGALFSPALKSLLIYKQPKAHHKKLFSYVNITGNAGTILGPLFGVLFSAQQFPLLSLLSGLLFILIGCTLLGLPIQQETANSDISFLSGLKQIVANQPLLMMIGLMIPYHFIHQQLFLTYPVVATKISGSSGWIFTLVTVIVIATQMKVTAWTYRFTARQSLQAGYLILGTTFLPLLAFEHVVTLTVSLMGIALSVTLMQPTFHSYIVSQASAQTLGIFLGFSNLAMAVGGALGNITGGSLYEWFETNRLGGFYWAILALLSFIAYLTAKTQKH